MNFFPKRQKRIDGRRTTGFLLAGHHRRCVAILRTWLARPTFPGRAPSPSTSPGEKGKDLYAMRPARVLPITSAAPQLPQPPAGSPLCGSQSAPYPQDLGGSRPVLKKNEGLEKTRT